MSIFRHKRNIQWPDLGEIDFPGWLKIATDKLEESARKRIALEIESHFADAVAAHLAEGQSEISAEATALASLGDPRQIAKRLKKSHLTVLESKSMNWTRATAAKPFFSSNFDWLLAVSILLLVGVNWRFQMLSAMALAIYLGFRAVPRLLFRWDPNRAHLNREFAFSRLVGISAAWLLCAYCNVLPFPQAALMLLFAAACSAFSWHGPGEAFLIWKKLRHALQS